MKRLFFSGLFVSTLILGVSLIVFFSCDNIKTKHYNESEKTKVTLTYQTMFDLRTVQRARRSTIRHDKEISTKLFQEALDRKKKGQFSRSSDLFKKSILIYPTSKSFFYLGEVSLEINQPDMAISSLKMAELLNYPNLSTLYIRLAKSYSIKNDLTKAAYYLSLGLEKGYTDLYQIVYDPAFKNLRTTSEYREAVADVAHNEIARKQALFNLFISKFPTKSLPFSLDNESIENFDYDHFIPFDFQELLVEKYMKDEAREYSFVARVDSTSNYIAVIYSSINAIEDDYPSSVENYLVTYDKFGNILDHTIFACNCNPEITIGGQIEESKEFKITEYENHWKSDPRSTEYIKNEIDTTIVKSEHFFKISQTGRILKIEKKKEIDSLLTVRA